MPQPNPPTVAVAIDRCLDRIASCVCTSFGRSAAFAGTYLSPTSSAVGARLCTRLTARADGQTTFAIGSARGTIAVGRIG